MSSSVREGHPGDAGQLVAYLRRLVNEPDIYIALSPGEFKYSLEGERQLLEDVAASDNSVILVAEVDGQIIGVLAGKGGTLKSLQHTVRLNISVDKGWRGQGVGSALLGKVVQWARQTDTVTRLELYVFARNLAAIHLYEKFGFKVEGRLRKAMKRNDVYHDELIMSLLL